jgi:hypothetical protein
MDSVSQPGPLNLYRAVALLGVALMVVGIVGGAILKDFSVVGVLATTLPGIALLLFGIRGSSQDHV